MNKITNSLPVIAFLAVIAALILVPVSAVVAGFAVSVAGTLLIVSADYGRSVEPLRAKSRVIPFGAPGTPTVDLRRAA
jgi:di/tricarboxylate transporter